MDMKGELTHRIVGDLTNQGNNFGLLVDWNFLINLSFASRSKARLRRSERRSL
jgi:hypothetical protein